jgi:hypothetical protein
MSDNIHSGRAEFNKTLTSNLNKDYLDNLSKVANLKENITHRTILDHSLRDIIHDFTNNIIQIIDDIVLDLRDLTNDYEDDDTMDWMVRLMSVISNIFGHIMNKDNCLNIGILLIIISLFIHYFNITQ